MQISFILCAVCIISSWQTVSVQQDGTVSHESPWETFKLEHLVSFSNQAEDETRRRIFLENKRKIDAHNELYARGLVPYKLKMNKFGYLEDHEVTSMMTGFRQPAIIPDSDFVKVSDDIFATELPSFVDWRKFGAVTNIKNQGPCGSCWAFSAVGSLEGQFFLKTGQLVSFSEQNLIDCSVRDSGCTGGIMTSAFQYIKDNNNNVECEESYPEQPYNSQMNSKQCCAYRCRYKPKYGIDVGIEKIVVLPHGDENALRIFVSKVGPISVGIVAVGDFHFYDEGLYLNKEYNSTMEMNHAVVVVGYGTTAKGEDYWLVRNSWGLDWGLSGYMMIARNHDNHCQISSFACYPSLDSFPSFFDKNSQLTNKDQVVLLI